MAETPFNSERKFMTVTAVMQEAVVPPLGLNPPIVYFKGAIEVALEHCKYYIDPKGNALPFQEEDRQTLMRHMVSISSGGMRVLAFAQGSSMDELVFVGATAIWDPPRKGK